MSKKVTFRATKRVPKKIKISFRKDGKKISFLTTKRVPKRITGLFPRKRKKP